MYDMVPFTPFRVTDGQNPGWKLNSQIQFFAGRSNGRTRFTSATANPNRLKRKPAPALNTGWRYPPEKLG